MPRTVEAWSDGEFLQCSGEHLAYEIQMFLVARNMFVPPRRTLADAVVHNAIAEMRGLHARCLVDFLYNDAPRDTDVVAADFFPRSGDWRLIRGACSTTLTALKQRADREIAHLTTFRKSGTPPEKDWAEAELAELDPILRTFVENAPRSRLDPEVGRLLAAPASDLPRARIV
jgi:hypothetical protein